MNVSPYLIPSQAISFEEEIKKSHFITYLAHTPSIEEAKAFVDSIKAKHGDARHNCWAFVAGRPEDSMKWGFSDDGEPSGTAGKPILAQLTGSAIGEITAVVTRYYGGIRLGTGGLVKAYGGGVQQALQLLSTVEKKVTIQLLVEVDYSLISLTHSIMSLYSAIEVTAKYDTAAKFIVEIEVLNEAEFIQTLINKTGAKAQISRVS